MRYMKFGIVIFVFLLAATSLYSQEIVVTLLPYDGTNATFVNAQIVADTVAAGGMSADRVYEFQRDQYYYANALFTVPNGKTLRLRAAIGAGEKPIIYLWETGTGTNPTRPPGYFVVLNGGNIEVKDICIAGFYEWEPERVSGVQGCLIRNTAAGSSIVLDGVIFSNTNGNHVRTEQNVAKVKIINSIFANMGALTTSNLGAGKATDLRDVRVDSLILLNNTFVNYQDRAIRHYTIDPTKGVIDYALIDHNTFVNGMGFHGLFSLGNVGSSINITNNLFVDAFALGEDSTDATRAAEWANTGEIYSNGNNRITWIFSTPNAVTQWNITNNFFTISDSGWAFLNDFGFGPASPLSYHINSKLGADSVNAFTYDEDLTLVNIPRLMTNEMRWYEDPAGGNKTKNTPTDKFVVARDDMDRRMIEFYRDTLDCTYPTTSVTYTGAQMGYPVGDLNWYPELKVQWEQGAPLLSIVVDGAKDIFYETLTGPDDGYLQIKSYAFNDNGIPKGGDADLSANVWTAWDNKYFYLYEEVMDDTLSVAGAVNSWEGYLTDGLELKFDPQPTDSVTNSVVGLALTALSAYPSDSLNAVPDSMKQWIRKTVPGGYVLEMAVDWRAIKSGTETITPAEGNIFGMAVCQHDNDGNVALKRQASIEWGAVMKDAVWNTPKYHGTVKFLADHKLQFIPTNTMTGATNTIPYDGTPFYLRIDGKKDPFFYSLAGPDNGYVQIRSYAYNDNGKPADDADLSAKVWTAWDDEWFYLYEEVKDDTLAANATNVWEEDEIELKFDPQATDSTQTSTFELRLTALGKVTGVVAADSLNNVPDSMKQWTRTVVTGGYTLEMAIKWPVIKSGSETITPAVGTVFGMAICQHDNDGKARRQASVEWAAVLKDAVWNTPKYLGTVKFADDHQLQLIPTNNMTGATTIIPYDGSPFTGVEEIAQTRLPLEFSLEQNYPNPFNPSTTISYSIPSASHVRLVVYDIQGREVGLLVNGLRSPGFYQVTFDGKQLSSGIYFCVLETDSRIMKQKMLMIK